MITKENYFEKVKSLDPESFPDYLQEAYFYTKDATEDHTNWEYYTATEEIREVVDSYIADLNDYLKESPKPVKAAKKTKAVKKQENPELESKASDIAHQFIYAYVKRGDSLKSLQAGQLGVSGKKYSASIARDKILVTEIEGKEVNFTYPLKDVYNTLIEAIEKQNNQKPRRTKAVRHTKRAAPKPEPKRKKEPKPAPAYEKVERITDEVRFIKRFALLHDKVKSPDQIRSFINALQKAILEKRIRKTSKYAKEIMFIQESLIYFIKKFKGPTTVKIKEDILDLFRSIAGSQKILLSAGYLKRYIGIQGKNLNKEKAVRLHNLIAKALNKEKIGSNDPYYKRVENALSSLESFIKSAKKGETLQVHEAVLNGIQSALDGCPCEGGKKRGKPVGDHVLAAVANDTPEIMSSVDFNRLRFNTLGFTGKWLELMGDPVPGFTAMVYGKPKLGKSYLCVDFASYLAQNFGKVLYVAKEEGLDATLQNKLRDKQAIHPNLYVAKSLPQDFSGFDFIFLDSATRLGLSPVELKELSAQYPGKSFVFVHQSIKDGNFRGSQEFQHDVDIVIEVYEKGKARQFGRFNQGGEMDIFEDSQDFKIAA